MSEHEFDRVLSSVVDDGPTEVPDRVIEAALATIPTTLQRGPAALSWRRPMFKPLAAVLVSAAMLAVAVIYIQLGPRGNVATPPSPSPTPTSSPTAPTSAIGPYTTSTFSLPITFPLRQGGATGYHVKETATAVTIIPPGTTSERLVLMPLDGTRVIGAAGADGAALPDTIVQLLDERAGFMASRLKAFDGDRAASYPFAGVDAPVVAVETDPREAVPNSPVLRTAAGATVDVADVPSTMWILPAVGSNAGDLIAVYYGSTGDFGNYGATLLTLLAEIQPVGS